MTAGQRLAALERQVAEMCGEMAALRASVDAHMWADRVADALGVLHVEKTSAPGFGHVAMRSLITEAIGLVPDLPKTVGTGCGRRRLIAMTSTVPEAVTCLPCRVYAREQYLTWAAIADVAAQLAEAEPRAAIAAKTTPADLRAEERTYRALAARFEVTR